MGKGFAGRLLVAPATQGLTVPDKVYDASVIVGATNVPDVLDITRVHQGTVIVDDSAPHCFDVKLAIERAEAKADILFTEGGLLSSPAPLSYQKN